MVSKDKAKRIKEEAERELQFPSEEFPGELLKHLFEDPNDRSVGIIAGTYLENKFEAVLKKHLSCPGDDAVQDLFGIERPLSAHGNKLKVALVFGVIDRPMFERFCFIKNVRNRFAHNIASGIGDEKHLLKFSSPPIVKLCEERGLEWDTTNTAYKDLKAVPKNVGVHKLFFLQVWMDLTVSLCYEARRDLPLGFKTGLYSYPDATRMRWEEVMSKNINRQDR
jgi:hypothetical protein